MAELVEVACTNVAGLGLAHLMLEQELQLSQKFNRNLQFEFKYLTSSVAQLQLILGLQLQVAVELLTQLKFLFSHRVRQTESYQIGTSNLN